MKELHEAGMTLPYPNDAGPHRERIIPTGADLHSYVVLMFIKRLSFAATYSSYT